jgi:hypothetical protein
MLNDPAMTQVDVVEAINAEAGKQLISKTSLWRFVQNREKYTGLKRGKIPPTHEETLLKIATALERIANSLEKLSKKQG